MQATLLAVAARAISGGKDFRIEPRESQTLESALGLNIVDVRR